MAETALGARSHGAFRPRPLLLPHCLWPLGAVLPFVLPNKLAPDSQVSQGLGKHLSRLVPSPCVYLLGRDLGSVHKQASPLRLRGSPHPQWPHAPPAGVPRWRSLYPLEVQPPCTLPNMPPWSLEIRHPPRARIISRSSVSHS